VGLLHLLGKRAMAFAQASRNHAVFHFPDGVSRQPSWALRLFGQPGFNEMTIGLSSDQGIDMIEEFEAAFPECKVNIKRAGDE
jgi:hypothetical protein